MVRPQHLIDAIVRSVQDSDYLPDDMNYLPYEAARTGADGNIKLPLLEVQPVDKIDIRDFNTDRVDYITDENENRVGRRFHSEYRLRVQFDVYTAQGSSYDSRNLGTNLWRALYRHDSAGPNQPLPKEDDSDASWTWRIEVEDEQPAHELTTTPSLRRWRVDVVIWSAMEFDTTESYITDYEITSGVTD